MWSDDKMKTEKALPLVWERVTAMGKICTPGSGRGIKVRTACGGKYTDIDFGPRFESQLCH